MSMFFHNIRSKICGPPPEPSILDRLKAFLGIIQLPANDRQSCLCDPLGFLSQWGRMDVILGLLLLLILFIVMIGLTQQWSECMNEAGGESSKKSSGATPRRRLSAVRKDD